MVPVTTSSWVLNGDTVYYSSAESVKETLDYDFTGFDSIRDIEDLQKIAVDKQK